MTKILTLVLFGLSLQSFGQVNDSFSDGNFSANPVWTGDMNKFIVSNGQLRSNAGVLGVALDYYLSTASTKATSAQWEFFINLKFATSGVNYVDVYLTSDVSDLNNTTRSGYFVRIGDVDDEISLYKIVSGAITKIIDGTNGIVNSSSDNPITVKVLRDAASLWKIEFVDGTSDPFVSGGSVTDAAVTTSSFFGVKIKQSTAATPANNHFFDDIYVGDIILDTTPPALQTVQVNSATELTLTFSESLESASSQQVSNYVVNNSIGNPATAVLLPDQKSVKLAFTNSFGNGIENQINVSGVKDLLGNAMATTSQTFLYFLGQPAVYNDIVLNELFPDPSPQIGLPAAEFVEIYNRSSKPFDLLNWKLSDPTTIGSLPSQILLPGEYLIITSTASVSSFTSFGKVIGLTNFPTLNNSNDAIKLVDATGLKIDSVNYDLTWYQDADKEQGGWTLERLNMQINTNEPTNWLASEDISGGTPGKQNSVFGKNPDSKSPVLLSVEVISSKQLRLSFNEALDPLSTSNASNFIVSNNIGNPSGVSVSEDKKNITLDFSLHFQNGVDHIIALSGIKDEAGNLINATEKTFRYLMTEPVNFKDVVITEIMADPSPIVQLPEAEYLEIYNRTPGPFDIGGWTLADATSMTKLSAQIILPGEYMILTSATNASKFTGKVVSVTSFPSLNNSGEPIVLKNAAGQLIDSVNYTLDWYRDEEKKDGGWSMELIDLNNPCGESDNWMASENSSGGTPGKTNSVNANKPDLAGPKLISVFANQNNQLKLTFNEKLEKPLSGIFTLSPAIPISSYAFSSIALKEITITLTEALTSRQLYTLEVKNLRDCAGNFIDENFNRLAFAQTEPADSLDIVINEILFNPRSGGVDFIELYNNSPKFLDLKNATVSNFNDGSAENIKAITTENYIFKPATYLVLTTDPQLLKSHYPSGSENVFSKTDLPTLPDDAGTVAINVGGKVIDFFAYSDDYHSPLLKEDEGVSLERILVSAATNNPNNWKSANASSGYATPGLFNSNSKPASVTEENAVIIEPEVFSPQQDFAKINYKFDQSNYSANVKILDAEGRLIKEVANNQTLSFEGFFRWDGDREDGTKARKGYYTVWVEVFDLTGMVKTFRKRVVVTSN